jgi:hypothetical protein
MVFEFACNLEIYSLECDGHIKGHTSRHPLDCSRHCKTAGKQVMTQIKKLSSPQLSQNMIGIKEEMP